MSELKLAANEKKRNLKNNKITLSNSRGRFFSIRL